MRERVAQDHVRVELSRVAGRPGHEGHHDVGVRALRVDVGLGVALAPVELGQHLVRGVAAPSAVALELPGSAQLLRRRSATSTSCTLRSVSVWKLSRPSTTRKLAGRTYAGGSELAVAVVVHRLQHRLAAPQVDQVLGEDVEVVAVRVERGEPELARRRRS